MIGSGLYTLDDDHTLVPCHDFIVWSIWMHNDDHIRVRETTVGRYWISTVFLGQSVREPPMLFETMVFDHSPDTEAYTREQRRYATWQEAEAGHDAMVALYKAQEPSHG